MDDGCHFVGVYYQSMDKFMNSYITRFRKNSIILKPDYLHIKYKKGTHLDESKEERKDSFNYSDYRKKLQEASDLLENLEID